MARRSTGIFPREKFDLDANLEVTTTDTACNVTLAHIKTIRVIVIGAAVTGDATLTANIGGQDVVFGVNDFDKSGVGIAHLRGALCDADNLVKYTLAQGTGSITVSKVFLDMVENVG
tara:strand:+ start:177 stop:527 length:351 start_codon:yes stop_codon:yes gene_type:complete